MREGTKAQPDTDHVAGLNVSFRFYEAGEDSPNRTNNLEGMDSVGLRHASVKSDVRVAREFVRD